MKNEGTLFLVLIAIAFVIIIYPKFTGLLISSPSVPGIIDSCGVLDTPEMYVLNSSINTNTTCFKINASNILLNCNNSLITGNGTGNGFESSFSNITIINCRLSNFENGILLFNSSNDTLENNIISEGNSGILLNSSTNAKIVKNLFDYNEFAGVYLELSGNTAIINNTFTGNGDSGLYLVNSNINMNGNNVTGNKWGISIFSTNGSLIYDNYFDNTFNVYAEGFNSWNISLTNRTNIIHGNLTGGNFWRNYNGEDTDGDGIGDTHIPFDSFGEIEEGGDYLPLYLEGLSSAPEATTINTYTPNGTELSAGYEQTLNSTDRIAFVFNTTSHYLVMQGFTSSAVSLSVVPDLINFNLNIAEEKKFDLNLDGVYDIAVSFIAIVEGLPEVKLQTIAEQTPQATPTPTPNVTTTPTPTPTPKPIPTPSPVPTTTSKGGGSGTIIIIIMVIILLGAGGFAAWYFLIHKKTAISSAAPAAGQAPVMSPGAEPGMGMPPSQ